MVVFVEVLAVAGPGGGGGGGVVVVVVAVHEAVLQVHGTQADGQLLRQRNVVSPVRRNMISYIIQVVH